MQPDFLQKIRFSQNFGESAKIGQKSCFSCFSQNLVYRCIYLFCLNWSSYILYTILSKLHIWEKSCLKLWPKWYYSIRLFKYEYLKIGWTDWADFFYGVKSFRGIQWMLNDFIFLCVFARACISHQEYFYLFFVEF